jgi:23S rRNA (guanosine2251-2'-O)-methyltransferase
MSAHRVLFGFHAVTVRLKTAPESVLEIHFDATRRDARMRQFVERAQAAQARLVESDDASLHKMCGTHRHQGVVARVDPVFKARTLAEVLEEVRGQPPPLLLDGVTDPQ